MSSLQYILCALNWLLHHAAISGEHEQCIIYFFIWYIQLSTKDTHPLLILHTVYCCYDRRNVIRLSRICSTDVKLQLSPPLHDCCCAEDVLKSKHCKSSVMTPLALAILAGIVSSGVCGMRYIILPISLPSGSAMTIRNSQEYKIVGR